MTAVALDTNILVAVVDATDTWHARAVDLSEQIANPRIDQVVFDLVYLEAVTVLARRASERTDTVGLPSLLAALESLIPFDEVTWLSTSVPRLASAAIDLVVTSGGRLNVNDALVALACRELGLSNLLSFDADFDEVPWLTRLASPEAVHAATESAG
jgi:predicted nucleic acid-binding protein